MHSQLSTPAQNSRLAEEIAQNTLTPEMVAQFHWGGEIELLETVCSMQIIVIWCCRNGHLTTLQQLNDWYGDQLQFSGSGCWALEEACKNGHLDIGHWILENFGCREASRRPFSRDTSTTANANRIVQQAVMENQLAVVKWLVEESSQFTGESVSLVSEDAYALQFAAKNGWLPMVRYIIEESGQYTGVVVDQTVENEFALQLAVSNDHLPVVQYLVEEACKFTGKQSRLTANENACICLAYELKNDRLLRYLLEESGQLEALFQNGLPNAIAGRGLRQLHALLEKHQVPLKDRRVFYASQPCREAAVAGLLPTLDAAEQLLRAAATQLSKKTRL